MHAVACHAIYGAGGRAGRVGKIKKVTEDCQENIRPLSLHVKEWEARGGEKPGRPPQVTQKSTLPPFGQKTDLKKRPESFANGGK